MTKKSSKLESLFCGILFCISIAALVIACLAFTKKKPGVSSTMTAPTPSTQCVAGTPVICKDAYGKCEVTEINPKYFPHPCGNNGAQCWPPTADGMNSCYDS